MSRNRVVHNETSLKIDKETKAVLKKYRMDHGLGTYEEALEKLLGIGKPKKRIHKEKIESVGGVPYNEYMRKYMNFRNHTKGFCNEVRRRDNHSCVLCGSKVGNRRQVIVHHKDWDHENNTMDNCVCLCDLHHVLVHRGEIFL